jgi:hypothetical protein
VTRLLYLIQRADTYDEPKKKRTEATINFLASDSDKAPPLYEVLDQVRLHHEPKKCSECTRAPAEYSDGGE